MQDLILTKLADIGDLKVISRISTAKYASHPDDPKAIGQQLGVATILEGSMQKLSNAATESASATSTAALATVISRVTRWPAGLRPTWD